MNLYKGKMFGSILVSFVVSIISYLSLGVSIRLNGSVSVFLFGFLFNRLYDEGNRTEPIFFRFFDLKTEI